MPGMLRAAQFFACAPKPGLAERAHVMILDASTTLPRVATDRVAKKRVVKWREGDGAHWPGGCRWRKTLTRA